MKTCALLSILVLFASCVASDAKVTVGGFNRHAPMIWNGGFPKEIRISEDFSNDVDDDEQAVIKNMAMAWNNSIEDGFNFFTIGSPLSKSALNPNYSQLDTDNIFGIYRVTKMPERTSSAALAVTVLQLKTQNYGEANEYNQIFYADIFVNDIYYTRTETLSGIDYEARGIYDLNTIMVHELGHFLGLEHSSSTKTNSVMIPAINGNDSMNAPLSHDIVAISNKYNLGPKKITTGAAAMSAPRPNYVPDNKEDTPFVKYIIELRADGECVHSVDGEIVERHKR